MNKFNLIALPLIAMLIVSCGISDDEKNRVSAVTCSIIKETKNFQSSDRVKLVNDAREQIKSPPFLEGDEMIQRSIQFNTCELLIKNSDEYAQLTDLNEQKFLAQVEEERLAIIAREKRIALEKKVVADREAAEMKAEEERKKAVLLAEYEKNKESIKQKATQACKDLKLAESSIFVFETLGEYVSKSEKSKMKQEPLITAGVSTKWAKDLLPIINIRKNTDLLKKGGKNKKLVNCANEIMPKSCELIVEMGILYKYFPNIQAAQYQKINEGVQECMSL
jgi:hypothetical protein